MTLQPAKVLAADAELWATTYLRAAILARAEAYTDNVHVSNAVPNPRKPRMVIVRRDGGPQRGVFDFARLAVRVWAADEQDAADLARMVQALLLTAPGGGVCVHAVSLSGPSPVPDESKQPQRYLTVQLTMRGTAL